MSFVSFQRVKLTKKNVVYIRQGEIMAIVRYTQEELEKMKGQSNEDRLKNMTEEENVRYLYFMARRNDQ